MKNIHINMPQTPKAPSSSNSNTYSTPNLCILLYCYCILLYCYLLLYLLYCYCYLLYCYCILYIAILLLYIVIVIYCILLYNVIIKELYPGRLETINGIRLSLLTLLDSNLPGTPLHHPKP